MRILIVGAGPAGLALAAALRAHGMTAVVVERAEQNRAAGYAIGVHVNGWNAAERLGLLDAFRARAVSLARRNIAARRAGASSPIVIML